jgi:hypothetical protein
MITAADLARLRIARTIFHDVPSRPRNVEGGPILADLETAIDARRAHILNTRITQVLGSKQAYSIRFSAAPANQVPFEIRNFTARNQGAVEFVQMSRRLAEYLYAQHTGATSPGLLCVMSITAGHKPGIAILKLERQEGAEIKFTGAEGHRVFSMDVLENLILTDKTRLFKSAAFLRGGPEDDQFELGACDSQGPEDMARFWMTYLGCELDEEPRVVTRRWFETSLEFANEQIVDPVTLNNFYEHLHSELNSNRQRVSPRQFIEDNLPPALRAPYTEFLQQHRVSLQAFTKDTSEIKARLRRRSFHTEHGISVVVPEQEQNLVNVRERQIVVNDHLVRIDNK